MDRVEIGKGILILAIVVGLIYMIVGTPSRVDEIKERAPNEIESKGWDIIRYEGWAYGSMFNHGGKVYYHVKNKDNENIQYRVKVTLWDGELHYTYGDPEQLYRIDVTPLIEQPGVVSDTLTLETIN